MKILLVTNSKIFSGAGIIAKDFRDTFLLQNIDARILVNQYSGESDYLYNIQSETESNKIAKLRFLTKNKFFNFFITNTLRFFSFFHSTSNGLIFKALHINKYFVQDINQTKDIYSTDKLLKKIDGFQPKAIIVLFMQNFLTYKNVYELGRECGNIPVYITVLDMAPLTGGCHYSWQCTNYKSDCSKCPAVSNNFRKFPIKNLNFKKEFSKKGNFNFIYSSDYQLNILKSAAITSNNKYYKIPLPTDELIYNNNFETSQLYRSKLGFKELDIVVFFGAMDLKNPRKGGDLLIETIKKLNLENQLTNLKFLIIGENHSVFSNIIPSDNLKALNVVSPSELPNYYNASDIFLSSSIEDAGPMMVNQSLMCGTRVCTFEVGVAIDMVKPNEQCRRCATEFSANELYKSLTQEIEYQRANNRKELREQCAKKAYTITSKEEVSKRWLEVFQTTKNITGQC